MGNTMRYMAFFLVVFSTTAVAVAKTVSIQKQLKLIKINLRKPKEYLMKRRAL